MKKITSLILVAMMLLALLPMCFMTAAADTPIETFGDLTFETVTIYDAGDPVAALESGGWNHTTDAAGSQLAASGKNPAEAVGILIDLKWDALAANTAYARLKFKINNILQGDTGGYYLSKDGTKSGFFNDDNWMQIAEAAFDGTVFLPADLFAGGFAGLTTDNIGAVSVALSGTNGGTWDNVRLAYGKYTLPVTEDINGNTFETISLYDSDEPTLMGSGGSNWQEFATTLDSINRDPRTADGILIDVKWESAAMSAVKIKFQLDTTPRTEGSNGSLNGYFFGKGDYAGLSGEYTSGNWMLITATAWEGTIFIPADQLNNWSTKATFNYISVNAENEGGKNTGVYFDNVRLAYGEVKQTEVPTAPDGPTTLPDGSTYSNISPLFDLSKSFGIATHNTLQTGVMASGGSAAFIDDAKGVLFTLDARELDKDMTFDFEFILETYLGNGTRLFLATTPYGGAIQRRDYTNVPEVRPDTNPVSAEWHSDWYLSYNGGEWVKQTNERGWYEAESRYAGGRYGVVPKAGGNLVYIYIPLSEFWTSDGEEFLKTGKHPSEKENIVAFEDFVDIAYANGGKGWKVTGVNFNYNKLDGNNTKVKLSNFWVIGCDHEWTVGAQAIAPTHTAEGWNSATCAKCGTTSLHPTAIAKTTEHEWPTTYTNLEDGTHGIVCPCGEKQISEHTWGEAVEALSPTHMTVGVVRQTCTAEGCGATKNAELPMTPDHNYTYAKIDDVQHNKHCACGDDVNEAHVWDDGTVTVEPTVDAEGVKNFTCVCGATKTEAIAKLPSADDAKKDDGGCGSVIGSGLAMMAILSGAAVVLTKKRRK